MNVPIRAVEDLRKSQGCSVQSGASWPVSSASPGSLAPGAYRPPPPSHACAVMQHRRPGGQGSPEGRAEQLRQTSGQREAKPPGPWQKWDISRTEALVALCDPRASPRQLHHKTRLRPGKGPRLLMLSERREEGAQLYVEPVTESPTAAGPRVNGHAQTPLAASLRDPLEFPAREGLQAPWGLSSLRTQPQRAAVFLSD